MRSWFLAPWLFIVGAAIGSFLNVCIYRIPREQSVVRPPSHCFFCGTRLRGRDLIPLLSYLLLRRRCRYCGVPFSSRYFWGELATGLLLLFLFLRYGWGGELLFAALFACSLVPIFAIDLEHRIIPHELNLVAFLVGVARDGFHLATAQAPLVRLPWGWPLPLASSLLGALVGWLLLSLVVWVGRWWFGQEAMGGGDVRFAAAAGAYFGPGVNLATLLLVAVVLGAIVGVALIALRLRKRRDYIPFGPFLTVGAAVVLLFPGLGQSLLHSYLGLLGQG